MTQFYSRTALLLLACSALAACTTYQPLSDQPGGEPLQPKFPTRLPPPPAAAQPAPPAPSAQPPAVRDDSGMTAPRPASPVESRPLDAPVASRPLVVTPSYVPGPGENAPPPAAQPAPAPPAYTPPAYTPPAYTPPAYTPPAPPPPPRTETRTEVRRTVTGKVVDTEGPPVVHTVKKGDNLYAIARKMEVDVDDLAKQNKIKAPYTLQPGDKIKGPRTTVKAYVVGQGDTLFAISRRFSVTAAALADANDISKNAALKPGRKLILPEGYKDKGPIKTEVKVEVQVPQPAWQPPAPTRPPAPAPQPSYQPPAATPPAYRPPASTAPTYQPYRPPAPPPYQAPAPRPAAPPSATQPTTPYQPTPPARPPAPQPTPYNPNPTPPAAATRPTVPSTIPPGGIVPSTGPIGDAQISQLGRGRFLWPLRGELISTFGPKGTGQRNDGINIRVAAGETVRAAAAGDVVYAGDQVPGFGNLVLVKHADGWVTAYGHLGRVDVKMQQKVEQGQQLGISGASGGVGEPQLHFEVRYAPTPSDRARPVDPQLVLPR